MTQAERTQSGPLIRKRLSFRPNIVTMPPSNPHRGLPPGAIGTPCDLGDHESCGHQWGLGGSLPIFKQAKSLVTLCPCTCHEKCLATRRQNRNGVVPQDEWLNECDCPGAGEKKARIRALPRDDKKVNPISAPKRVLGLVALGFGLHRAYRKQTKEDGVPKGVFLNERSNEIRNRSIELATDQREDDSAVAELVALVGRHRNDAEVAALDLCTENRCHESRIYNRAHRLLRAAITSEPLAPPADADIELMEVVRHLYQLPMDAMFVELAAKEPRLNEVKALVRAGELGAPIDTTILSLRDEERRDFARNWLERHQALRQRLLPLVGPEAEVDDLALRSYFAQNTVEQYLQELAGIKRREPPS